MKKALLLVFIAVFAGIIGAWFATHAPSKPQSKKLQVVTSFYPLYFFAKEIGGEKVEVKNITPAGAEPHDFEPSTQDVAQIEKSNLLIINGGGFEPWGDKIANDLGGKHVTVVRAAEGIMQQDPHVWLDPVRAKLEAQTIVQAFKKIDPTNASYYQSNMIKLGEKFDTLNLDFQTGLRSCQQKNIVTSHAAFGYIASRYNLSQVSIAGLSPDSEPSPRKLTEIAAFAKANNVHYIFFEELVSPKLAETIATEVGAKTLVLNPLEGLTKEEESAGKDYFLLQRENLANLKIALTCK